MPGKCGKCEKVVAEAKLEHMNISDGTMRIAAFSASCPHCGTTMGVVLDPRPMDTNLLAIKKAVGSR
jgi:hypothetical protein